MRWSGGNLSRELRSAPQQMARGMFRTRTVAALVMAIHFLAVATRQCPAPNRDHATRRDDGYNVQFQQQTRPRDLATRCVRALRRLPPSKTRGRRESRVRAAPAVSCAKGVG